MNAWTRRALLTVLLAALVLLAGAGLAYRTLWSGYDGALSQLEARSERLDGLVNAGPDIAERLESARRAVAPWLHPAGENAANDVQQSLRELISATGNTLVSSQVALEPGAEGKLARVRLTATITGDWPRLVRFMQDLQRRTPPFWVSTASLSREGANTAGAAQTARLAVQLDAPLAPQAPQKGQP